MLWWIAAVAVGLVVLAMAWIRLAPEDPERWHVAPDVTADETLPNGVRRSVATWPDGLERLDAIILASPRTRRAAGSVRAGMVTYVTRSRFWGFPDYTTVAQADRTLTLFARSRYGKSDLGVNRGRAEAWLARLQDQD